VFEKAAAKHPDIVFAKVDTDAQPALSAGFGIRSIPTLMAFRWPPNKSQISADRRSRDVEARERDVMPLS